MVGIAPQAEEFTGEQVGVEDGRAEFAPVEEAATPAREPQAFDPHATLQGMDERPASLSVEPPQAEATAADVTPVAVDLEEAVETGSATTTGASQQISLEQLSPEVIDAIARRAVEHLSERVVQEIAWEVVPQLAELLIKRKLEEEKQ
jgi:hypothetical protein